MLVRCTAMGLVILLLLCLVPKSATSIADAVGEQRRPPQLPTVNGRSGKEWESGWHAPRSWELNGARSVSVSAALLKELAAIERAPIEAGEEVLEVTSSTAASSTKASSTAASSTKASSTAASSTAASSTAASSTKASSTAASSTKASSTAASSTKASSTAASSTAASSTAASSTKASSSKTSSSKTSSSKASSSKPSSSAASSTEASTTTTTTTSTTTSTTTTASPPDNTTTSSKSKWWIALVVVLPVAALAAVAVVLWCRCTGKVCFAAPASLTDRDTELASNYPTYSGGKEASSSKRDGSSLSNGAGATRCPNPLSLTSPFASVRAMPLVAGDPAHVNRRSNCPYQVNGLVPWTGRPPVLRGPQPMCVIPTIERDGTIIPREKRVSPGLGLYETPKIFLDPHPASSSSPPPSSYGSRAALTKLSNLFNKKVRRRSRSASTAAAPEPRQWYHQLIHFTPLEHSPDTSQSDVSEAQTVVKEDDTEFTNDADTIAAPRVGSSAAAARVVAVPLNVRKYSESTAAPNAEGGGNCAPRPQEMNRPVLYRLHPPTEPANSRRHSAAADFGEYGEAAFGEYGEAAFGEYGGAACALHYSQSRLSAQAASSSSIREAEVPPPLDDPVGHNYSWRSGENSDD
ncbi:hypothetical protein ABB37_09157 [Leptomonas pyrrhocoris]|uniref:Proteophosphoglycan ppg4 n=1 Tax=Leptomonas pyrrhocoris TaxID=157538 RepID=A0A0N0DRH2_LEPPY|nr:hypothetical protein ABB37_09157 [Leptomonas pyrrhocoris]XP_015652930.1 hypothetical protein ABB37_09157 [Leptomonas pyrrhocoris]XP_015652931.1 hypothetical protein ABB37_09157 [Leptomonas pyrrhocoris]KPA74490.1 hypothetical protein ABB37_09157 [Leptomonas pyrrhocoris]KPA74491.1 hypothetical protein ABB37_09157 [Leptomonas pyrrhocoris]KPA74492.1 hypothetical protein ABB37_09157 [Leptomonas pyrrhocoris]|eukprot:XP_015652929.1 hypothetical protein ABB37_09157 [Leptomonas pyrrhocoris]